MERWALSLLLRRTPSNMKAAFLVGPNHFDVREIPDLVAPSDGLVLKVEACGVCGSDLRRWKEGPIAGSEPLIPGHEISGTVIGVGALISDYQPGDQLAVAPDVHCGKCYYCQRGFYNLCDQLHLVGITSGYPGGFSEKMILTEEVLTNGVVHRIPAGLTFEEAALAEPLSSVLACHANLGTSLQDTVVVMGAGPIGCMHIAIAKARGALVILSEPSALRREMAQVFQPEYVVDPFQKNLREIVLSATGHVGADIVICANPVAATHTQAVEVVRKHGKIVLFGGLPKASPMTSLNGNLIHYGEVQVVGSFSYHPTFHALALQTIHRQQVRADQLITDTFPLEKINEAFQAAASGNSLKVIIKM